MPTPDPATATHGFAIVNVGFGIAATLATVAAYLATHPRTAAEPAIAPAAVLSRSN